jgi:hypothetical protein
MVTRVEQTPGMEAGRARVAATLAGTLDASTLEIGLSRVDRGSPQYLNPSAGEEQQAWVTGERWFVPEAARADNGSLVFEVGPAVTWRLKPFMTYMLHLRDGRGGRLDDRLTWSRVRLPSTPPDPLPAEPERRPAPVALPQAEPEPDPLDHFAELARTAPEPPLPLPEPVPPSVSPEPAPPAPSGRGHMALVAALALVLLAGAGVGTYAYLWQEPTPIPAEPAPPPVVTAPATPEPPPIAMTVEGARGYILQTKPSAANAAAMASRFAEAGAVEGAFLLRQHAARNGDVASAAELGRLYDPKFFAAGKSPVASASADRAIDWYERAAEAGNPEALSRLPELLKDPSVSRPDAPERAAFWSRKAAEVAGTSQEATP